MLIGDLWFGRSQLFRANPMKLHFFVVVVLIALSSAGSAQVAELTVDQAKKLLPQAAGISNADFKALLKDRRADVVKSKSLSLVLFALRPPMNPDAGKDKEFRVLGNDIKVSDITDAMWISKDKGYASFIQPKYITECSCESTAGGAEGVVAFKTDLFAGRIHFVARRANDGWIISEFRLPQYKIRVVRGKDGGWVQKAMKGK
jgi:hypothetical protein